ncbi:hypothetical protein IWZ00DRAFT_100237 [Phyllosticta capitalensis]
MMVMFEMCLFVYMHEVLSARLDLSASPLADDQPDPEPTLHTAAVKRSAPIAMSSCQQDCRHIIKSTNYITLPTANRTPTDDDPQTSFVRSLSTPPVPSTTTLPLARMSLLRSTRFLTLAVKPPPPPPPPPAGSKLTLPPSTSRKPCFWLYCACANHDMHAAARVAKFMSCSSVVADASPIEMGVSDLHVCCSFGGCM